MFLSTSPTFMLVQNGLVRELQVHSTVHLVSQSTVETDSLCRSNVQYPYHFRSLYDFSRTAASVLRLYMLEASGMRALYNPMFSALQQNLASAVRTDFPSGVQMAHGHFLRALRFAAEFDRLFPHCLIEYRLKGMAVGNTKTISGHMYVIYFDEKIIYQIDTTMNVTLQNPIPDEFGMMIPGMFIRASVHVVVSKYNFQEPIINFRNHHKFKRFTLVKELANEWSPSQNPIVPIVPLMRSLSL